MGEGQAREKSGLVGGQNLELENSPSAILRWDFSYAGVSRSFFIQTLPLLLPFHGKANIIFREALRGGARAGHIIEFG